LPKCLIFQKFPSQIRERIGELFWSKRGLRNIYLTCLL